MVLRGSAGTVYANPSYTGSVFDAIGGDASGIRIDAGTITVVSCVVSYTRFKQI